MHPDVAPAAWVLLAVLSDEAPEVAGQVAKRFKEQVSRELRFAKTPVAPKMLHLL